MSPGRLPLACALLLAAAAIGRSDSAPLSAPDLEKKIQAEVGGPALPELAKNPAVPQGETLQGVVDDSRIYPGSENKFTVYVPAQYKPEKPACLLLKLDGMGKDIPIVLDNLIAQGDVPVMIAVAVNPGTMWKTPEKDAYRWNRSYEFDSLNGNLPRYILEELLPRVEKMTAKDGRALRLSADPNDRMTLGASTGGIGAFTLAWERPDSFRRVYSFIGTFVGLRGGNEYPLLVRKTDPKPLRVFLEDGATDAPTPVFGSWFEQNQEMESALAFAGYDVGHAWGQHGHDGKPGTAILPDVLRWLWRGWPAPVAAGVSTNATLREILLPGEDWQPVADGHAAVTALASTPKGEVVLADGARRELFRLGLDGQETSFASKTPLLAGLASGPDGVLYATDPAEGRIVAWNTAGTQRIVAEGIRGRDITATDQGRLLVTEPGLHSDEPSQVWAVAPNGEKKALDSGLLSASGLALSTDKEMLFVAEAATKWVYGYRVLPDGSLADKQPFYWLHMPDVPNDSGAAGMAVDSVGTLYVATRMGIQVCDRNGRVRAILPLPSPAGAATSLCWGGAAFDTLYATDGKRIFKRKFKVPGCPSWAPPAASPPGGGG